MTRQPAPMSRAGHSLRSTQAQVEVPYRTAADACRSTSSSGARAPSVTTGFVPGMAVAVTGGRDDAARRKWPLPAWWDWRFTIGALVRGMS